MTNKKKNKFDIHAKSKAHVIYLVKSYMEFRNKEIYKWRKEAIKKLPRAKPLTIPSNAQK